VEKTQFETFFSSTTTIEVEVKTKCY